MNAQTFRGAPLGRPDTPADPARPVLRVSMWRVPINRQGYDASGAYWGLGAPLYHAAQEGGPWESWFRAADRDAAKREVRRVFGDHDVRFTR